MLNKVRKNKFNLVYEQILSDLSQNIPTTDPDIDQETLDLMKKYNLTEKDLSNVIYKENDPDYPNKPYNEVYKYELANLTKYENDEYLDDVISIVNTTDNFKTMCWIMDFLNYSRTNSVLHRFTDNEKYQSFTDFIYNSISYYDDPADYPNMDEVEDNFLQAILYQFDDNPYLPKPMKELLHEWFSKKYFSVVWWNNNRFNSDSDYDPDSDYIKVK